jgi:preprotein translocase subunit SecF
MFLKQGQQPPRKIETPDLILIALVLLFNSGLLNRLEDFGISKDGGVTARFKQLKQEVNEQKKQIDELQAQQLEQLEKQQKNLEEMQAFMYNFLLGEKDYEKIDQLNQHSTTETNYDFYVSERVGDELRRLRDLKLIALKSGYISDLVRASDYGKRSIDLTQYLDVTELGKKFLLTRETLQSKNQ